MGNSNLERYVKKIIGVAVHFVETIKEITQNMQKEGKLLPLSDKGKVYSLQGLLIVGAALIALIFMFMGNYLYVSGNKHGIQDVFEYAMGSTERASVETGIFFFLLVISAGLALLGMLFVKLRTITSVIGLIVIGFFEYFFTSDSNGVVEYVGDSIKGIAFYVPSFMGYVILFLFGWSIYETHMKKQKG